MIQFEAAALNYSGYARVVPVSRLSGLIDRARFTLILLGMDKAD